MKERDRSPPSPPALARLWLLLLPRRFRNRFGEELELNIALDWQQVENAGAHERLSFWLRTLGELLVTVPRELLADIGQDVRYSIRTLAKRPLFSLIAVLSLAIGIGATTSVLAIFDATFGRGIPGIENGDRLLNVKLALADEETFSLTSFPIYTQLRDSGAIEGVAGFSGIRMSWQQNREATPELLGVQAVTDNYFSLLGVQPTLGRLLTREDEETGEPVAVISHHLWSERYGARRDTVGSTLVFNGQPYTIVGVSGPRFRGHFIGFNFDAFISIGMGARAGLPDRQDRSANWVEMVGAHAVGSSLEQARAALAIEAQRLEGAYPKELNGLAISPERTDGHDADIRGGLAAFLAILAGVSGFVLLIGCVNVANLMLGRLVRRRQELELRAALGAPRSRLARLQLTESAILAIAGGVIGGWIAYGVALLASRSVPALGGVSVDVRLDWRTLLGAVLISTIAASIFGLLPALRASRASLSNSVRGAGAASGSKRTRSLLVIAQVALSVVILVTAGLFLRAFQVAAALDPGFNPQQVEAVRLSPTLTGMSPAAATALLGEALQSARAMPGVQSAALAGNVPLSLGARFFPNTIGVEVPGVDPPPGKKAFQIEHQVISPGYLEVLQIPLLRGRDFETQDTQPALAEENMEGRENARGVALVNETFASRFGGDRPMVGSILRLDDTDALVIGVVSDSLYRTLDEQPMPFLYLPTGQVELTRASLLVRTEPGRGGLGAELRARLQRLAPTLPLQDLAPLEESLAVSLLPQRIAGSVAAALGLVGLFLTAVGIYGVLAQMVTARTPEIGLRMSLGARPTDVLRLVIQSGLTMAILGLSLGIAVALLAARGLSRFLYGVGSFDLLVYGTITAVLIAVAVLAAYLPARRAVAIDPLRVLRTE